ncbi:phage tail protein [Brucella pituitosa]|uniref:phage tail protein n=1 Tax=Brucella pituitosa TaxID=571256 RepID=UPI0009A178C1|nr:phage tail protein [Brucella pituitosa]
MSSIYDWSLQAANNANADDNIDWAEGQPPSSVNNSARAMMQRVKEFLTDIGGVAKAEGTPNLLSVTVKSPFTKYVDGIRLTVRATSTNTAAASLNVNAIGAKPIYCVTAAGVGAVAAGQIQAGGIYEFIYNAALADGAGGWFMPSPTQGQALPAGLVLPVAAPVAPSGFLYCNGQAVSRTYAGLFAVIGGWWGAGNGSTTFNVPDYRGVFLRGYDDGRGLDPGRGFASYQGSQNLWHGHSFSGQTNGAGGHDHDLGTRECTYGPLVQIGRAGGNWSGMSPNRTSWVGDHSHSFSGSTSGEGGNEARPVSHAVYYVIKT